MASKVDEFVAGLRAMADWYEQHPELDTPTSALMVSSFASDETPELAAQVAQAMGTFKKNYSDSIFTLTKSFGGASLQFLFYRNAVCTKRVVKTETVTEWVPDPAAPKVEVTREREIVEWDCPPLLAREVSEAA